ncbi:MAG: YibE/F family protein [Candidatus Gracilibacteria bacterium]
MEFRKIFATAFLSLFIAGTTLSAAYAQTADELEAVTSESEAPAIDAAEPQAVPTFSIAEKTDVYVEAVVTRVDEREELITPEDGEYNGALEGIQKRLIQQVEIKVFSKGDFEGKVFSTENSVANRPKDITLKKGDRVIADIIQTKGSDKLEVNVIDFSRNTVMWAFLLAFTIAIIAFGGRKGLAAVLGLVVTFVIIFAVFIPFIMQGGNPMWLAIGTSIVVTFLVHIFVGGFSPKSLSSTAGTAGGMLVAGLFASIATGMSHLHGISTDDSVNLFLKNPNLDFHGIFLAGIIIGSLGAVMDIGISISSAISEVKSHAPQATFKQLFTAGMNIGKDTLGTMTNTLVLAYAGSALPLILIMVLSATNWNMAIGYDFIADEIVRSMAGAFGLLVTIPITAYVSALLEIKQSEKNAAKISS